MILIAALALALSAVHPWPIGVGPRYQLPATTPAVRAGICKPHTVRFAAHVEVFAHRRVVVLPQGIGVGASCRHAASTNSPTGVIRLTRAVTLGNFFRTWGQPLDSHRLLSFRGTTLAFVDGRRWSGDPRRIRLTRHVQVVLEIGGYVAPHPSYLFPKGMP